MSDRDVYREHGHADRDAYLRSLAEAHDMAEEVVKSLADLLGPEEDFDGLVVALEDAEGMDWDA